MDNYSQTETVPQGCCALYFENFLLSYLNACLLERSKCRKSNYLFFLEQTEKITVFNLDLSYGQLIILNVGCCTKYLFSSKFTAFEPVEKAPRSLYYGNIDMMFYETNIVSMSQKYIILLAAMQHSFGCSIYM